MRCFSKNAAPELRHAHAARPGLRFVWPAICAVTFACTVHGAAPLAKPTHHASIAAATEAASGDQSLVLVIFGAEWCGPCKLLKKETLPSDEFISKAGALRIVEVDIDSDQKAAVAYAVSAVPTLLLMTAEGKIATRHVGFMDVTQMLTWLNEGRERVEKGQWEGTAPGMKLNEFVTKAAADRLEEADLRKLVVLVGEPDPSERASAAKLLLAQREAAMTPLIDGLANPYLGVRIGAAEILKKLVPEAANVDPWQSPQELGDAVAGLKKWWADNGKLSSTTQEPSIDSSQLGSVKAALEALRTNEGAKRTEAMSTLVTHGAAALPEIRAAIKRGDKAGDHRTVSLLEEVRWAILVPDSIEQRANVRIPLARGTSQERQAAATRLGRNGRDAIPALAELVTEADPLVVENAVRALSNIGGKDSVPAMVALLKAPDANLRMTAAQALGHTKSAEATAPLLKAAGDSNEVVACTALSAIEEIHARENDYSTTSRTFAPELISALNAALSDSRWRVRATAAEVVGKLKVSELKGDLKKLLGDADGFVVKSSLAALAAMTALPEAEQLGALAKRLPSMRGEALKLMAKASPIDAVPVATDLYTNSNTSDRLAILAALGHRDRFENEPMAEPWQPFVAAALREPDPALRRAAAKLLIRLPTKAVATFVAEPLQDEDREVQSAAAEMVLWIVSGRESRSSYDVTGIDEREFSMADIGNSGGKTNEPLATPARQAAWHEVMSKRAGESVDPVLAAAICVTGNGKAELQRLAKSLERSDPVAAQRLATSPGVALLMPKLAWPESEPVLNALSNSPALFAVAASKSFSAAAPVRDWFTNAARFTTVLERADERDLTIGLQAVLRTGRGVALLTPSETHFEIARTLAQSTNAGCRAAGVYALGFQGNPNAIAVLTNAARDKHPGVRAAAVQSLARKSSDRNELESYLAPMLADEDRHVAQMAALSLLEPEIRNAAGSDSWLQMFVFENIYAGTSSVTSDNDERPLVTLETKPAYLELARAQIKKTTGDDPGPFALLLAQHGDFDAIPPFAARISSEKGRGNATVLLTAIALSRDPKFVPLLRAMMDETKDQWELRSILRALRGMGGPEVRQLRLEINRQMRKTAE